MDRNHAANHSTPEQQELLAKASSLERGGTAEWRELYHQARNPAERQRIRQALQMLNQKANGGTIKLWQTLLNNLEKRAELGQSEECIEEHFQKKEAWKKEPGNRYTEEELKHLWRGKLSFERQPPPPSMEL